MLVESEVIKKLIPQTEKISGIYKIENKLNHKKYIGQSVDVYRRLKKHLWDYDLNNETYLSRAIKKYGAENFTYELVEQCKKDELNDKEIYYIQYYHSYIQDPNGGGYNLNLGGGSNYGWTPTKVWREKMAENNREGKSHFAKKTWCDGILFPSAVSAAIHLEIADTTVKDWLSKKAKMPKRIYDRGLHYDGETMDEYQIAPPPKNIKVKYNNYIYNSIRQFCFVEEIDRNLIRKIRSGEKEIPQFLKDGGFEFLEPNNNSK